MFKKHDSAHSHYMCMIDIRRVLQRKEIIGKSKEPEVSVTFFKLFMFVYKYIQYTDRIISGLKRTL